MGAQGRAYEVMLLWVELTQQHRLMWQGGDGSCLVCAGGEYRGWKGMAWNVFAVSDLDQSEGPI